MIREDRPSAPLRFCIFSLTCLFLCLFSFCSAVHAQQELQSGKGNIPKMTLGDAVLLALKNNFDVQGLYLNRINQRFSLKVAEDKFMPSGTFGLSMKRTSKYSEGDRTTGNTGTGTFATTKMNVITGGNFAFNWSQSGTQTDVGVNYSYNPTWTLTFTQPLLKNAGIEVATASVQIARIGDEVNLLTFRNTLTGTIGSVIQAFRNYISALMNLDISRQSLETAKRTFETNKAKIEAGRMAQTDIVETETNIASSELTVLSNQNQVDAARLSLIQLLNIDKDTVFEPVKEAAIYPAPPTLEEALSIALQNRPDYLSAVRNVETARLNWVVARNNRLWDLSFSTGVGNGATNTTFWSATSSAWSAGKSDWNAGLSLTIPFRDLTIEQNYLQNKIAYDQSRLSLNKTKLSVEIDIRNRLRNVDMSLKQMRKATQARQLSQRKFEIENDKYKAGRSTNFQLVTYQNDLVKAAQDEVTNLISYLNALTDLDSALGTTLRTWNIEISKDADEVRKKVGMEREAAIKREAEAEKSQGQ